MECPGEAMGMQLSLEFSLELRHVDLQAVRVKCLIRPAFTSCMFKMCDLSQGGEERPRAGGIVQLADFLPIAGAVPAGPRHAEPGAAVA